MTAPEAQTETHAALRAVFRQELPKLIAALSRRLGDVGRAEELAQEALLIALESGLRRAYRRTPAPG